MALDTFNLNTIMGPKPVYQAPAAPKPAAVAPPKPGSNGVFWRGADGKVYVKGGSGTNAAGAFDNNTVNYWTSRGFAQIADPNPPQGGGSAAPGNPTGSSGGGSTYQDKSADIQIANSQLGAEDTKLNSGLSSADKALADLMLGYDTEAGNAKKSYDANVAQNNNNLQSNKQTAFTNAVQGRRGLFGTLASLGALSGSGIDLANRAVQRGANEDLSGAQDTFNANNTAQKTAYDTFGAEDAQRRKDAEKATENVKQNVRNSVAKERQGFYVQLANDYHDEGNSAMAKHYTDLAASLSPEVAQTSIPAALPTYVAAPFTAPTLSNYLGGGNTAVKTTPQNAQGVPGLFAGGFLAPNQKKQNS